MKIHKIVLPSTKAVIFDMDGTMISNMPYHRQAWMEFAKRHGIKMSKKDFMKKISGRKNDQILEILLGKRLTREKVAEFSEEKEEIYRELYAPDIKEVEGLTSVIRALKRKGVNLAIATTASKKNREFVLEKLALTDVFPVIVGDEHVRFGKPNPEIFLKTAEQLSSNPVDCLVFEDTPVGVEAAKSAGMTVVGVLTRHTRKELKKANLTINDYTELVIS